MRADTWLPKAMMAPCSRGEDIMADTQKPAVELNDLHLAVNEIRDAIRNIASAPGEEEGEEVGEVHCVVLCGGLLWLREVGESSACV